MLVSGATADNGPGQGDATLTTELTAAIDGLIEVDPDALGDGELAEAVVELHRQQTRLAAAVTRVTAALDGRRVWADDGSRSCAAWVGHRCRVAPGQARAEVWLGRRLRTMPATARALEAGEVSLRHAGLLAELNGGRTADRFAEDEAMLVEFARTLGWRDFRAALEYWRQQADPDGVEDDAAHDEALRRVHLSEGLRGTGVLDGLLTPLGRATVGGALARIEQELFEADWARARADHGQAACVGHLTRSPAQRRHDALVELARRAMAAPDEARRPRPLISVLVGYETFKGRVCELADGTVVTPGTVASLLDEALIERVVFDGPSRVIDLGRARRFTGALRRALEVRDRHCGHVGCDVPAERCQGDHIDPWSAGGPTSVDNGQLRCGSHNRWRWHDTNPPPAPDPPAPDPPAPDPPAPVPPPPRPPPDADLPRRMAWLEVRRAHLRAQVLAEQRLQPDG
jgi:hypothetical protein